MNEYKSVRKYLKKAPKRNIFLKLLSKVLICIILVLGVLIFVKTDERRYQKVSKFLYEHNISFAKINKLYQEKFGDILPFQSISKESVKPVFEEKLKYKDANIYKDGVKLSVDKGYLVPIIKSGIVVFEGEKEGFGKTIIIEQVDGVSTWYGNLSNINVKLYDYVDEGEFLAEITDGNLYMAFQKDGKYLNYKEYLS